MGDLLNICHGNNLAVAEIRDIFELALETRRLYSIHYKNGIGFVVGKDSVKPGKIREMIPDPHGLLPRLTSQTGAYSNLEKGLLFSCMVACQSLRGGGTLFTFITGRPREGVRLISQKLKGIDDIPL